MSASAAPPIASSVDALVEAYLRVLANERGASTHTLRAYQRELRGFAAWLAEIQTAIVQRVERRIEHTHIRAYLGALYDRGLSKASAARALAAIRSWFKWLARAKYIEQNAASLVATPRLPKHLPRVPSIEQMNRVVDSVRERRSKLAGAGQGDSGDALWLRHPQRGADRIESGRHSLGQRGDSGARQGAEAALRAAGRRGGRGAARVSRRALGAAGARPAAQGEPETPALFLNLQLRGLGKTGGRRG